MRVIRINLRKLAAIEKARLSLHGSRTSKMSLLRIRIISQREVRNPRTGASSKKRALSAISAQRLPPTTLMMFRAWNHGE